MKSVTKVLTGLLIFMTILSVASAVFAIGNMDVNITYGGTGKIKEIANPILGALQVIGMVTAVGILIYLGIKYVVGSASDKAEFKKSAVPFVVGVIVIFAAVAIMTAIKGIIPA